MGRLQTDWLKARKKELRISDELIGSAIGRDRSIANKLISGALPFDTKYVDGLAQALKLSREDVLFRFGVLEAPPSQIDAEPAKPVPVIGEIAAGNWREAVQRSTMAIPAPHPSMPPNSFALEVSGDSMDLLVEDGAMIIVDPGDRQFFHKRYYAVQNEEGETTFKQYLGDPARLVPCSSNPSHREIILGDEPIMIIGRIIWRSSRM